MEEQLLGVDPELEDVVEEREERGQGEGAHEDGDEAVLDHCKFNMSSSVFLLHLFETSGAYEVSSSSLFCCTGLPLNGSDQHFQATVHFPLTRSNFRQGSIG